VGLGEGSILIFMTPADNAGGNQDLSSTRKGAQNSGSGSPLKNIIQVTAKIIRVTRVGKIPRGLNMQNELMRLVLVV
jgi:hypothetical protein